ncbi:AI-2E family transporter [Amphibiibacter pelophylacis]|uniref:AI-2E family transporter n=1 Tax=Amphibiibacter pelophylacis TaxID=1799477 RepID=A0ACC6P2M5_9BURK
MSPEPRPSRHSLFPPGWNSRATWTWLALIVLTLWLLWLLAPILTPFVVGVVLAYVLQPAVRALVARRVPPSLAVVGVLVLVILSLLSLFLLLVPVVMTQVPKLVTQVPLLAERFNDTVAPLLQRLGLDVQIDVAGVRRLVLEHFQVNSEGWMTQGLAWLRTGSGVALSVLGNAVLIPLVTFFILADFATLSAKAKRLVPPRWLPAVQSFMAESNEALGQYLRGQLSLMLVLAAYFSIGWSMVGLSVALPVGVFTGLAFFIPYVGPGLGILLATLSALLDATGWGTVAGVIGVFITGQLLESFVLTPRLVGERLGMSPVAVLFALMAFGHLLGFTGVLIALPASAVLLVALRRASGWYLASDIYTGDDTQDDADNDRPGGADAVNPSRRNPSGRDA